MDHILYQSVVSFASGPMMSWLMKMVARPIMMPAKGMSITGGIMAPPKR